MDNNRQKKGYEPFSAPPLVQFQSPPGSPDSPQHAPSMSPRSLPPPASPDEVYQRSPSIAQSASPDDSQRSSYKIDSTFNTRRSKSPVSGSGSLQGVSPLRSRDETQTSLHPAAGITTSFSNSAPQSRPPALHVGPKREAGILDDTESESESDDEPRRRRMDRRRNEYNKSSYRKGYEEHLAATAAATNTSTDRQRSKSPESRRRKPPPREEKEDERRKERIEEKRENYAVMNPLYVVSKAEMLLKKLEADCIDIKDEDLNDILAEAVQLDVAVGKLSSRRAQLLKELENFVEIESTVIRRIHAELPAAMQKVINIADGKITVNEEEVENGGKHLELLKMPPVAPPTGMSTFAPPPGFPPMPSLLGKGPGGMQNLPNMPPFPNGPPGMNNMPPGFPSMPPGMHFPVGPDGKPLAPPPGMHLPMGPDGKFLPPPIGPDGNPMPLPFPMQMQNMSPPREKRPHTPDDDLGMDMGEKRPRTPPGEPMDVSVSAHQTFSVPPPTTMPDLSRPPPITSVAGGMTKSSSLNALPDLAKPPPTMQHTKNFGMCSTVVREAKELCITEVQWTSETETVQSTAKASESQQPAAPYMNKFPPSHPPPGPPPSIAGPFGGSGGPGNPNDISKNVTSLLTSALMGPTKPMGQGPPPSGFSVPVAVPPPAMGGFGPTVGPPPPVPVPVPPATGPLNPNLLSMPPPMRTRGVTGEIVEMRSPVAVARKVMRAFPPWETSNSSHRDKLWPSKYYILFPMRVHRRDCFVNYKTMRSYGKQICLPWLRGYGHRCGLFKACGWPRTFGSLLPSTMNINYAFSPEVTELIQNGVLVPVLPGRMRFPAPFPVYPMFHPMHRQAIGPDEGPAQMRKLFIGGLSHETTDDQLRHYFAQWGVVVDAIVIRDPQAKSSRGFGFVTFATIAAAENAMMDRPHVVGGKTVDSKRAIPREQMTPMFPPPFFDSDCDPGCKLMLSGIHWGYHTVDCLRVYFEKFGSLEQIEILGQPRGLGFVLFEDKDSADKALAHGGGRHFVNGRKVDVRPFPKPATNTYWRRSQQPLYEQMHNLTVSDEKHMMKEDRKNIYDDDSNYGGTNTEDEKSSEHDSSSSGLETDSPSNTSQ